jgi:hypothetical protein
VCERFYAKRQLWPFYTKVIAATASEAPHVLDGLLYQTDDPAAATGPF